jgi:monoamine oxidase
MSKIIVIGAGAAGLMAAYKLSAAGHNIILLEAQDYLGGRIHSLHHPGFSCPVELGAEFIHGNLPVTLGLMKEAGIPTSENGGTFWNITDGKVQQGFGGMSNWHELEKALELVQTDMSIDDFLGKYLNSEEQIGLRDFVKGFAEGYDAGDTSRMSVLAFKDEFMSEDDSAEYRVQGGYSRLIDYMANESRKAGCEIHTSSVATEIIWSRGNATAVSEHGSFTGEKIIITIPAGLLQAESGLGVIKFTPAISEKAKLFQAIGYGNAMKVFLEFKTVFWQKEFYVNRFGKKINELGFIVSDATIPVWWTQFPNNHSLLTGWIGGPGTKKFEANTDEEILDIALESIAYIFGIEKIEISHELKAWKVIDWAKNSFERGGYTYATVEGIKLRDTLNAPIEDTLYFAGEAFYNGAEMGTVEAALASGKKIAELILA